MPRTRRIARRVVGCRRATPLRRTFAKPRKDRAESFADATDRDWYQTVFGDAAWLRWPPTASLHLTPELLQFNTLRVELEVGAGTLQTRDHRSIGRSPHAHRTLSCAPRDVGGSPPGDLPHRGGHHRLRTLESLPSPLPTEDWSAETDLLIMPGHTFRLGRWLADQFPPRPQHPLALVAAFTGIDRLRALYDEAVQEGYRFHSYGDAMLLLPGDHA